MLPLQSRLWMAARRPVSLAPRLPRCAPPLAALLARQPPLQRIRCAATLTLPTEESETPPHTAADDSEIPPGSSVGHLYFDSVFPLTLGVLDPRAYLLALQGETSLSKLEGVLPDVSKIGFDFRILGVESRAKDGGAFLTFAYRPDASATVDSKAIRRKIPCSTTLTNEEASTLTIINARIRPQLKPIPMSILSPSRFLPASLASPPRAHIVIGTPWLEDLARYPSRTIKIVFGKDGSPTEQELWGMLRPYGRVVKLDLDGKENEATAVFARMRGATAARNCLYGATVGGRRMVIDYLPPLHTHKLWNWFTSHPRIVLPVLAFFLGSITYAVFDPIRGWFIKSHVENTFDLDAYPLYAWVRTKTVGFFSLDSGSGKNSTQDDWWERREASNEIQAWLREPPSTFITISGPRGSGKHGLLQRAIKNNKVKHLTISCDEIAHTCKNEEATLVPAVAKEVGYFPVFNWINSLNSLIDLASVGLIGSKAGFSTPTDAQLKQVLSVTTAALVSIKEDMLKEKEKEAKRAAKAKAGQGSAAPVTNKQSEEEKEEKPAVARNRDELGPDAKLLAPTTGDGEEKGFDVPVVVIDGFHHKGVKSDLLWTVMGDWAAELTTSKVAHVVFVSDNPVAMSKTLSHSLPNLPFNTILLADADESRARGYVYSKLKELGKAGEPSGPASTTAATKQSSSSIMSMLTGETDKGSRQGDVQRAGAAHQEEGKLDSATAQWVDLLGGRLTDLENLVQKVSLGQTVENAVKDIIARTVVEIRKNAFGDDMDDAKTLPWSRSQAWTVVEQLADRGELSYYALLHDSFKGDESAIKALEQAEIISVRHRDSRPSTIKAGRPVIQQALSSLVADRVFSDTQRYLSNASSIESCETLIRDVEGEIRALSESVNNGGNIIKGSQATKDRFEYLLEKLADNQEKIRTLEGKNAALRKSLAVEEPES